MANKRYFLAQCFERVKLLDLLLRRQKPFFFVLNYHRLYKGNLNTTIDEGVFTHSLEIFRNQMLWLKSNFRMIDEETLLTKIEEKEPFTERTVLVTFDDGYRDNFEIAYPILRELEIPAIFFVACNHISGEVLPWWDQAAYMIKQSSVSCFEFSGQTVRVSKDRQELNAEIRKVLAVFKNSPTDRSEELLQELSEVCDYPVPGSENLNAEFMSWDQLKELTGHGFAVGSHSMNHRIMSQLSAQEQRQELEESRQMLEQKLDTTVRSIAYPVGGPTSFTDETVSISQDCGYKLGFSFIHGTYGNHVSDRFRIHRVQLDKNPDMFKAQALMPKLFLNRQS